MGRKLNIVYCGRSGGSYTSCGIIHYSGACLYSPIRGAADVGKGWNPGVKDELQCRFRFGCSERMALGSVSDCVSWSIKRYDRIITKHPQPCTVAS